MLNGWNFDRWDFTAKCLQLSQHFWSPPYSNHYYGSQTVVCSDAESTTTSAVATTGSTTTAAVSSATTATATAGVNFMSPHFGRRVFWQIFIQELPIKYYPCSTDQH
jgi:hypothetical protein